MLETKQKGIITELQCLTFFSKYGFNVSIPYGENSRYDFILDVNNHLLRIQVKTCHGFMNTNNEFAGIEFATKSTQLNTQVKKTVLYTSDEIDYFATYWDDVCYLVPVEECSVEKRLWFISPKQPTACLAENYTVEKQLADYVDDFEVIERESKNSLNYVREVKTNITCKNCGKPIFSKTVTGLCLECYQETLKVGRPTREELKELIYNHTFVELGKMFNVSDNAVRKWCKGYNLPFQKTVIKKMTKGEWEKI